MFHFVIMHVEVSINIAKVLFIVLHVFSKGKILFLKKKDDKAINKNRGKWQVEMHLLGWSSVTWEEESHTSSVILRNSLNCDYHC